MTDASLLPAVRLNGVSLRYKKTEALSNIALDIPSGRIVGLIGPDGVGKSSLLSLIAGSRAIQTGHVEVLGGDMSDAAHRREICPKIAYMPQGLGRNLYATLSVFENIDFFGRLFGYGAAERKQRIEMLARATGLSAFMDRPAGKLSGGMKQKLGLCCALIHDPDLLILDEPTTGVDPLARRQFWDLIDGIRADRPAMSVLVATAYMEEAMRFDRLIAMHAGRVLDSDTPKAMLTKTEATSLEAAFVRLLPEDLRREYEPLTIPPQPDEVTDRDIAIEADGLTMRFGDFTAVDHVSFRIRRGEIFGFLGSNGCGKTTTMKMLTGLLEPTEGDAQLFGQIVEPTDLATRRRVGYMSQFFSLYTELTVRQNLELHAKLFHVPPGEIAQRVTEVVGQFGLTDHLNALPDKLPLGHRQRLSLAVAMIHKPEILILDEPTSGVDPVARDAFWRIIADLSRRDGVTIFISTHFMNEAERCDRISLMHAGQVLATAPPKTLVADRGAETLEDAFIGYLEEATSAVSDDTQSVPQTTETAPAPTTSANGNGLDGWRRHFNPRRMFSYARRETLELIRDPIRLTMAMLGSTILLFVMGYGVSMDVDGLTYAVLDRDQTTTSQDYTLNLAGSRYFEEQPPLAGYADLDRRMRDGEISLAVEIPPGFARDIARGRTVEVAAWIDGAMPMRADTVVGYVQAIHAQWLSVKARESGRAGLLTAPAGIEIRYRYNPDVKSLIAMVPAIIPILLVMIPAMLASLSVVREKELGSITNFFVTPTTKLEFLLGKQVPYIALSMVSFLILALFAVFLFEVPMKGSVFALTLGAFLYISATTAIGLLISSFMRSQIAALFGTTIMTMLPAVSFSGLIDPVPSLSGLGRVIGEVYPTTHFLTIARGTFSKALGFSDLSSSFVALALTIPVLIFLSVLLLKKQEA